MLFPVPVDSEIYISSPDSAQIAKSRYDRPFFILTTTLGRVLELIRERWREGAREATYSQTTKISALRGGTRGHKGAQKSASYLRQVKNSLAAANKQAGASEQDLLEDPSKNK